MSFDIDKLHVYNKQKCIIGECFYNRSDNFEETSSNDETKPKLLESDFSLTYWNA